jgi:nicotinamidase-related amidase
MTLSLTPANSLVLLIDWQDRLVGAMPPAIEASHRAKAEVLLRSAAAAGVPVVVTEQYPKGLGHTVESLRDAIRAVEEASGQPVPVIEKRDFAATDVDEVNDLIEASGRTHIVVVGMESHICVWQTVRALTERGLSVHVPRDAVISRRTNDYEAALSLYLNTGAVVTSVEAVAFDWVRRAEGDVFKAISRLVR